MGKFGLLPRAVAILVFTLVVPSVFSAPHTSSQNSVCSIPECRQRHDTKLRYEIGKSYVYDFESQTTTQVVGTSDETSKLTIKGQAVIAAHTPCDLTLTIQQASIQTPSGQAVNRLEALEGSSVRFGYQDGSIEELCTTENDPTWSANVKRGLVSLLQNKALKTSGESIITESDISGSCPTQYTVSGDRYVKTRNLNACTRREGGKTISNGVPYNVPSKYNSVPGVNSTFECVQNLKSGIFQSISCTEGHMLEAFARGDAGIQTTVKASMTLSSTPAGNQGAKLSQAATPASIYFDYYDSQDAQRQRAGSSMTTELLNQLCAEVENGVVSSKVPGLFLQLKKALKYARVEDLKTAREEILSGKMCQKGAAKLDKLLLDAAAMSTSDGAIGLLADIQLNSSGLRGETKKYFYTYAAFASQPGAPALLAMSSLLKNNAEPDSGLLLAASGLAHQYCKMSNPACGASDEYQELVNLLAKVAATNCASTSQTKMDKAVTALQALGNLDMLTTEAVRSVEKCLEVSSDRIMVHALQSFRRDPCQAQLKQHAQTLFANARKSSEVRIQAYIATTRCLQNKDVTVLQTVFKQEQSNQVASFVASHIRNQLETTSPTKQEDKALLRTLESSMTREASADPRKFSQNYEWSAFSSEYNWGAAAEGNVIYSSKSFLPRQIDANLSILAFGRDYNLLQMGVYLEDFEHSIEKLFGPEGKLKTSSFADLVKEGGESLKEFGQSVSSRIKRSSGTPYLDDNQVEAYQKEVDIESTAGRAGHGDMYIRILGTSILVDSFNQESWAKSLVSESFLQGMDKFLEGAKDHKADLTQPILFVDDEVSLPTISGLPLNLVLEGTTVLSMQMSSNVDLAKLLKDGQTNEIKIKIAPSSATVIRARMSSGAGPIEAGLQLEGKIHSSSGVEIKMTQEKGTFDLQFNLPYEKSQLLDVRTDLYWVEQQAESMEKKKPVSTILSQKSYSNDCVSSDVFGLKMCADVKYPKTNSRSPYFPLSGPAVFSFGLEKTETSMEGFHVRIQNRLDDEDEKTISILLDTPGSFKKRKISALGKFTKFPNQRFEVDIDSPWKKFNAFYERELSDSLRSAKIGLRADESEYELKAQMTFAGDSATGVYTYSPLIRYSGPTGFGTQTFLEGTLTSAQGKKLSVDVTTNAGRFSPLAGQIKAEIEMDSQDSSNYEYRVKNAEVNYPDWGVGKLGVSGSLKTADPAYNLNMVATYGQQASTLAIDTEMTRISKERIMLKTTVASSDVPALNLKLDWEARRDQRTEGVEHKFEMVQGKDADQLTLKHHTIYNVQSSQNFESLNEIQVIRASSDLDLYGKLAAKRVAGESQSYELQGRSGQEHQVDLKMTSGPDAFFDYNVKALLKYPEQTYEIVETAKKVEDDTWKYDTSFVATPGAKYNAFTLLRLKNERNDVENSISSTITSDAWSTPVIFKSGVIKKATTSSAHFLIESEGAKKVDLTTEYKQQTGAKPHAIAFKALVQDYLKAQMAETHTRTSSNLVMDATWMPTNRQVKVETAVKLVGEQFNWDGELKWDAGRDESKVAKIHSVTTIGKNSWFIDSVNDLKVENHKSKIALKGKLAKEVLNGEHYMDFSYKNSEEKNVALSVRNIMENTSRVKSSKLNLRVELLDAQPYELEWENRLANIDTSAMTYEVLTDMKFTYEGQKNLNIHGEINSLFPGNKRAWNGQIEVSGSAFSKPISYDYNTELKPGQLKTSFNARHGHKLSNIEVGIKFDKNSPKKTADVVWKVTLPVHPKVLEGTNRYTYTFNSWRDFEMTEVGNFAANNGVPTTWNNLLRAQENDFEALTEITDEGKPMLNFGIAGRKDKKRFTLDLQAMVKGHGGKFYTNVEGAFPYTNLRANGSYTPKYSQKNYKFNLVHRSNHGGQSYETDLTVNQNGERFALSNKLENFSKRKSLDLLWVDGHTPRKVYFLLTENTPKYNLESFVKWGEGGKSVTTKGSLETGNDTFDAVFSMDSEALKTDKWSARMSRKLTNGRHAMALSVEGKNQLIVSVGAEYMQKKERSGGETYDGLVKVQAERLHFNGKFRLEDGYLEKKRDGEEGRQMKAIVSLDGTDYPLKLTLLSKKSDMEKRAFISFCNDEDQDCKQADITLRHEHHKNGQDVDYTLKAVTQSIASGNKTTDGFVVKASRSEQGQDFHHTAQLIVDEEKEGQVGYSMYRKAGKEVGLEINLPDRIVSTVATRKRSPGHEAAELSLWMDKKRKPETRLNVLLQWDEVKSEDNAEGRETLVMIKHPALSEDMKFRTRLVHGGEDNILDIIAEIKAFKHGGELFLATKVKRESLDQGHVYKSHFIAKSEKLALNFEARSEAKRAAGEMAIRTSMAYETREHKMMQSNVSFAYSPESFSFAVQNPGQSEPTLALATSWNNKKYGSSSSDIRYEFLMPGMQDARIFESQLSSDMPPSANIKMFTAGANPGEYYEAFVGFKSDRQFAAGLYKQKAQERRTIGDVNLALNSSRLLFFKADWDVENLRTALEEAQERLQQTGENFKNKMNYNLDESSKEAQFMLTNLQKSMLDLSPLYQSYKNEMKAIRHELRHNKDTKHIHQYILIAEHMMDEYAHWAANIWDTVSDAIESFASRFSDFIGSVPENLSSLRNQIPDFVQAIQESFTQAVDTLVRGVNRAMSAAKDVLERISSISTSSNLAFLNDSTKGAGKYLSRTVAYTVEKIADMFEFVKDTSFSFMENSMVKEAVTKILRRYENFLVDLIENAKSQADTFRELVLTAFPQRQSQEFILAVFRYAERKAQGDMVDDEAEQREIYNKFVAALQQVGSDIWTLDWKNGLIMAQIPLPKPIHSLGEFNNLFMIDLPAWNFNFKQPSFSYGLTEFYNFVKADSPAHVLYRVLFTTESLIPPVPSYAMLMGSQYIKTFDGQFYHFEGNCNYLLASDFVDKNFTMGIQFEGDGPKIKKSILINYMGDAAVINPDFSAEVKGSKLRMDKSVDNYVTVSSSNGAIAVTCAKKQDVCIFALNGFYHGKSRGLLGTNNMEAFDDFSTPSGRILDNSEEFVSHWKLDRVCREKAIPPHPAVATREARDQCKNAFTGGYSPLRSCFGMVNPALFQKVCESLSSEKGFDPKKAVCTSSLAYAESCATSFITVQAPSHC